MIAQALCGRFRKRARERLRKRVMRARVERTEGRMKYARCVLGVTGKVRAEIALSAGNRRIGADGWTRGQSRNAAIEIAVRSVSEAEMRAFLEKATDRSADARAPVTNRVMHEDGRAVAHRRCGKAKIGEHCIFEMQAIDKHCIEWPVARDHIGSDGANRCIGTRESCSSGKSTGVKMEARANTKFFRGARSDVLSTHREIGGAKVAMHRIKLDLEWKIRIDGVDLDVGMREQHEQRAGADKGSDFKHARAGLARNRMLECDGEVGGKILGIGRGD